MSILDEKNSSASEKDTSSEDDEEAKLLTDELEEGFLKVLSRLKKKDETVYDENVTYYSQQTDDNPSEDLNELRKLKTDKLKEWLEGKEENVNDPDVEKDLEGLHDFWANPNINKDDQFLRDYILNKKFLEEDKDFDIRKALETLDSEEEELDKQLEYEEKFNMRFEQNADQEYVPLKMNNKRKEKKKSLGLINVPSEAKMQQGNAKGNLKKKLPDKKRKHGKEEVPAIKSGESPKKKLKINKNNQNVNANGQLNKYQMVPVKVEGRPNPAQSKTNKSRKRKITNEETKKIGEAPNKETTLDNNVSEPTTSDQRSVMEPRKKRHTKTEKKAKKKQISEAPNKGTTSDNNVSETTSDKSDVKNVNKRKLSRATRRAKTKQLINGKDFKAIMKAKNKNKKKSVESTIPSDVKMAESNLKDRLVPFVNSPTKKQQTNSNNQTGQLIKSESLESPKKAKMRQKKKKSSELSLPSNVKKTEKNFNFQGKLDVPFIKSEKSPRKAQQTNTNHQNVKTNGPHIIKSEIAKYPNQESTSDNDLSNTSTSDKSSKQLRRAKRRLRRKGLRTCIQISKSPKQLKKKKNKSVILNVLSNEKITENNSNFQGKLDYIKLEESPTKAQQTNSRHQKVKTNRKHIIKSKVSKSPKQLNKKKKNKPVRLNVPSSEKNKEKNFNLQGTLDYIKLEESPIKAQQTNSRRQKVKTNRKLIIKSKIAKDPKRETTFRKNLSNTSTSNRIGKPLKMAKQMAQRNTMIKIYQPKADNSKNNTEDNKVTPIKNKLKGLSTGMAEKINKSRQRRKE